MKRISFIIALVLAACAAADDADRVTSSASGLEVCAPVHLSTALQTGDVIEAEHDANGTAANLRAIAVDNGIVRLWYGARANDFRNTGFISWDGVTASSTPVMQNHEQVFAHFLEARHTDAAAVAGNPSCAGSACHDGSGTHWHDAQFAWYGDGAKYSTAAPNRDADRMRVLRADDDAVEIAYEWDDVPLDGYHYEGYCVLGYWPLCGPTSLDHEGQPVYVHSGLDQVKAIARAKVWKTVRVERCSPGYFVSLRSDPPLVGYEQGEREVRTGYVTSAVSWSCDGAHVAHHPDAGGHVSLGTGTCLADLPATQTGHNGWPFLRILKLHDPTPLASLQYTPDQLGSPGPTMVMMDHVGADGRPWPWQAFIGAVEYVSPDLSAEPTSTALDIMTAAMPEWPVD